jgi:hypothetical protein
VTLSKLLPAASLLGLALVLAYGPDVGRGFMQDDFRWIETSRVSSAGDAAALVRHQVGFYRPVVAATFAVNYAFSGIEPLAYGLTNLVLLLMGAGVLYAVARRVDLPPASALMAAGLWCFNPYAVNMAVLWVSGRTELLLCVFAFAAAYATVRGQRFRAAMFCLLALLSKEEAVTLPFVLAAGMLILAPARGPVAPRLRAALAHTWLLFAALGTYVVLRMQTDAFGPASAPPYYRPIFSPVAVARNVVEYLDRAVMWPAAVCILLMLAVRALPRFDERERRVLILSAIWFAGGYALTTFLPVRSSLYALYPSAAACLAAGAAGSALLRRFPKRAGLSLAALTFLPLLLVPVYRTRNVRWVETAALATHALEQIQRAAAQDPAARRVVLIDAVDERPNLDAAFGGLLPEALRLRLGDDYVGEIRADAQAAPEDDAGTIVLRLSGGRLTGYSIR